MSLCIKGARCLRLSSSKKYDIDFIIFNFLIFTSETYRPVVCICQKQSLCFHYHHYANYY